MYSIGACHSANLDRVLDIFVSYRSADARFGAAAIYELLTARFGRAHVFLDNQTIAPGTKYPDSLSAALEAMQVMLVLIGPNWLSADPANPGRTLIHNQGDWVRKEIQRAFERSVRVIPILLDGSPLPERDALPESIRALAHCQAIHISHLRLGEDVTQLGHKLTEIIPSLAAAAATPVPRQLPPAPSHFVGRERELALLIESMSDDDQANATVITGIGGIGKTSLALYWAHLNSDRFPDGQLFVDLRGSSPAGQPMDPSTALRCLLDALGVGHATMPIDLDAQIGRYRSLAAGRRMQIVLDNADNADQIRPLLPGGTTCSVLITSRDRLDGLVSSGGARRVQLDPLSDEEAQELLTRRVGRSRPLIEPAAMSAVVQHCAGLPLALSIVAGWVVGDDLPLAVPADALRDAATRLGALDTGDPSTSVNAVMSWSYDRLRPEEARAFALISLAPGPDIGLAAAAALIDRTVPDGRIVLRSLRRRSLVDEHNVDRWSVHNLVRLYATERAGTDVPELDRDQALRRLVDHYLHTACMADRHLDDDRPPLALDPPVAGAAPRPVASRVAAMSWFTTEHANLLAAQQLAAEQHWHLVVWQLAWVMQSFHWQQAHVRAQATTWQNALAAARRLDDVPGQAVALRRAGSAIARMGRPHEALDYLDQAVHLTAQVEDRREHAHAHRALARVREQLDDHTLSLSHALEALRRYQELQLPAHEADALDMLCWYNAKLHRYDEAVTYGMAALRLYRRIGSRVGEATALDSLGYVAQRTDRHRDAHRFYRHALELLRDHNAYHEANTLDRFAEVCTSLALHEQARAAWERSLDLYRAQERLEDAARVDGRLRMTKSPRGE